MFVMMNEARLGTGAQGLACASAAYIHALNYARERVQGRHLLKSMDKNAPAVPIIQHPDVRRMLMSMKADVEGMRSLLYYIGLCFDKLEVARDEAERDKYEGLIELLTPIAKGYVTHRSFEICNLAVQVYGGYGVIREYPVEQLLRDVRVTMIYEGTNGIQAMDFLGRKLGMKGGKPIMDLMDEIQKTIALARENQRTAGYADSLGAAVEKLGKTAMHMGSVARSEKVLSAFAFAWPFLEVAGDVLVAWQLLWRAAFAAKNLDNGAKKKDVAFYEGQVKSAEYYTQAVLPGTLGRMDAILKTNGAMVEISEDAFGGK